MQIPRISSLFGAKSLDGDRLAVVLGAHGVYLAGVKFSGAMPQVTRCEYHETGTVSVAALESLRSDAGIGGHRLTTLLLPGEYQILLVEAPNVPAEELKTAIRWKIKDSLNYHVDNATVDMLRIPSVQERAQSLYAVAAADATVRKCMALFEQAKLGLDVIDIPETAQRNVAALFEQEGRALALLAFDDNGGLLTLTSGGELYLTRRIEVSAGQLQDADENLREQSRDRVELELQRSLDYFDRQFNHLTVGRILVSAPGGAGLVDFLAGMMGTKVEKLDLSQVMDIGAVPALADSEFAAYALPALGAALRRRGERVSQQINLFNPAFVTRRQHFSLAAILQGLGLILAGSLAFYGYAERQVGELEKQKEESARRYQKEQARLARYAAEFSPQRAGQALQDEVRRLEKRVADQAELIEIIKSGAVGNAVGYAEYMRAFARQAPDGLWLTGFGISGDATRISLSGAVLDPELLPEYVQRLGKENVMRGKAFATLQMRQPKVESKGGDVGKGAIPRYVEFVLHSNPEDGAGK